MSIVKNNTEIFHNNNALHHLPTCRKYVFVNNLSIFYIYQQLSFYLEYKVLVCIQIMSVISMTYKHCSSSLLHSRIPAFSKKYNEVL